MFWPSSLSQWGPSSLRACCWWQLEVKPESENSFFQVGPCVPLRQKIAWVWVLVTFYYCKNSQCQCSDLLSKSIPHLGPDILEIGLKNGWCGSQPLRWPPMTYCMLCIVLFYIDRAGFYNHWAIVEMMVCDFLGCHKRHCIVFALFCLGRSQLQSCENTQGALWKDQYGEELRFHTILCKGAGYFGSRFFSLNNTLDDLPNILTITSWITLARTTQLSLSWISYPQKL